MRFSFPASTPAPSTQEVTMRKRVHAFTALAAAALATLAVSSSPFTGDTSTVSAIDCNVFPAASRGS